MESVPNLYNWRESIFSTLNPLGLGPCYHIRQVVLGKTGLFSFPTLRTQELIDSGESLYVFPVVHFLKT
jgi:hypothetical protein